MKQQKSPAEMLQKLLAESGNNIITSKCWSDGQYQEQEALFIAIGGVVIDVTTEVFSVLDSWSRHKYATLLRDLAGVVKLSDLLGVKVRVVQMPDAGEWLDEKKSYPKLLKRSETAVCLEPVEDLPTFNNIWIRTADGVFLARNTGDR